MALLSLEAIRDGIGSDPSLYPQNLDPVRQAILFLRLDEAAFRAASFLDDRILSPQLHGRWVTFAELEPWLPLSAHAARPLHFIFHAGHVGSTLVSRLLDEVGGVLGLREPLPLRSLAPAWAERDTRQALIGPARVQSLFQFFLACWSRGFAGTKHVVVKATSSTSPSCRPILEMLPESTAVCLNLAPEPYLATLLAGENSWLDLRAQAQARMKRLLEIATDVAPLHTYGLGEIAAMTWAVETLTHHAAAQRFGDRIRRVDFGAFLQEPGPALRELCAHFGITAPDGHFDRVAASPTLTRYSKAPEHAYTPELRGRILAESRARNGEEIRNGLKWIETLARAAPQVAAALSA